METGGSAGQQESQTATLYQSVRTLAEQLETLSGGFILAVPFTSQKRLSDLRFTRRVDVPIFIAYSLPLWEDSAVEDDVPVADSYTVTVTDVKNGVQQRNAVRTNSQLQELHCTGR